MDSIVELQLQSRPECVAVVRAMLAGADERLGFGPELLADLKTAVSEACNNVVMHAYDDAIGPLTVGMRTGDGAVEVAVADEGSGAIPASESVDSPGVGIPVIRALTEQVDFVSEPGHGSVVQMRFRHTGADDGIGAAAGRLFTANEAGIGTGGTASAEGGWSTGDVILSVTPVSLLSAILGRVAGCVAAEAHFSIDRYSDLYLVTDGVAAHASDHAWLDTINAGLAAAPRQVDLTIGPLESGSTTLLQPDGRDSSPAMLSLLVDEVRVDGLDGSEALRVTLTDRRDGGPAAA
jgi:serine/threonine-protein kinase RsbW